MNNSEKYIKCTDVYSGSDTIKEKAEIYLPYTPGMAMQIISKDLQEVLCAETRYRYYLDRAIFYNYFANTVDTAVGVIATDGFDALEVPEGIDTGNLNYDGENIYQINSKINMEQCITGRTGLLVNPKEGGVNLIQYYANSIIDYRYEIKEGEKTLTHLLLKDEDSKYLYAYINGKGYYQTTVIEDSEIASIEDAQNISGKETVPMINGKASDKIPFVFINAYNLKMEEQAPPFYDLALLCLDIYRNSADYQQYLFESSQNTLVLTGFEKKHFEEGVRVGSGATIITGNNDAKVFYAGIDASGLSVMHDSLKELKETALNTSIDIISTAKGESGIALDTKLFVKSSSIRLIAQTAASGIENALRISAEWMGISGEVKVTGNTKFTTATISIDNLIKLLDNKAVDLEQVHKYLFKLGVVDEQFQKKSQ